jgi:protein RecA
MPPRQSGLAKFREDLEKTYGSRVAPRREESDSKVYESVSTGSLTVDFALRTGGLVRGRIHELVGPPDSAKTTTTLNTIASFQRAFPRLAVGYVDMEGTFDDAWARLNGVDLGDRFDHVYADNAEDASDQARLLCGSGMHSLVVVDSVGGMESLKALAKDAKDPLPGANAQVITRMCKHLATLTRKTGATVVLVNQLRAMIGSMGGDVSAGPKAMQHATTTRITMARLGGEDTRVEMKFNDSGESEPVSQKFRARVTRSKVVPVGRVAEFWVNNRSTAEYGPAGINHADEYISMGRRLNVIELSGSWHTFPGGARANGRAAAVDMLIRDPDLCEVVRKAVLAGAM